MGFLSKLITSMAKEDAHSISELFSIMGKEDAQRQDFVNSHEFIWMNTKTNIYSQSYYIGAELVDDFLTFYLVIPSKRISHIIKSYQLTSAITPYNSIKGNAIINSDWFNYTETTDKIKILVISPWANGCEVFTDRFIFDAHNISNIKILEITMPKEFIELPES